MEFYRNMHYKNSHVIFSTQSNPVQVFIPVKWKIVPIMQKYWKMGNCRKDHQGNRQFHLLQFWKYEDLYVYWNWVWLYSYFISLGNENDRNGGAVVARRGYKKNIVCPLDFLVIEIMTMMMSRMKWWWNHACSLSFVVMQRIFPRFLELNVIFLLIVLSCCNSNFYWWFGRRYDDILIFWFQRNLSFCRSNTSENERKWDTCTAIGVWNFLFNIFGSRLSHWRCHFLLKNAFSYWFLWIFFLVIGCVFSEWTKKWDLNCIFLYQVLISLQPFLLPSPSHIVVNCHLEWNWS